MGRRDIKRYGRNFKANNSVKKSNPKRLHIPCEPNHRTFWKRHNYGSNRNDQWLPGVGGGKDEEAEHRQFLSVKLCSMIL